METTVNRQKIHKINRSCSFSSGVYDIERWIEQNSDKEIISVSHNYKPYDLSNGELFTAIIVYK